MFCAAHVLRSPGCWAQILHHVEEAFLDDMGHGLVISFEDPPEGAREWNEAWLRSNGLDPCDPDLTELLNIFGGFWFIVGVMTHFCRYRVKFTIAKLVPIVAALITRVLFPRGPDVPLPSRWFLVWSTLIWFRVIFGFHGFGAYVLKRALDPQFLTIALAEATKHFKEEREGEV